MSKIVREWWDYASPTKLMSYLTYDEMTTWKSRKAAEDYAKVAPGYKKIRRIRVTIEEVPDPKGKK